jgi:hypothetical protein
MKNIKILFMLITVAFSLSACFQEKNTREALKSSNNPNQENPNKITAGNITGYWSKVETSQLHQDEINTMGYLDKIKASQVQPNLKVIYGEKLSYKDKIRIEKILQKELVRTQKLNEAMKIDLKDTRPMPNYYGFPYSQPLF